MHQENERLLRWIRLNKQRQHLQEDLKKQNSQVDTDRWRQKGGAESDLESTTEVGGGAKPQSLDPKLV
jgi:hypothetical protein